MMQKYSLEFTLRVHGHSEKAVRNALSEFGDALTIRDCQEENSEARNLHIHINTQEPTLIFDICAQFGRIQSARVQEEGRE